MMRHFSPLQGVDPGEAVRWMSCDFVGMAD